MSLFVVSHVAFLLSFNSQGDSNFAAPLHCTSALQWFAFAMGRYKIVSSANRRTLDLIFSVMSFTIQRKGQDNRENGT